MHRLLISTITYLLVSVLSAQAQEDIVMKIGTHSVSKREFVNEYRKSSSTSVKEFMPQFIFRKMRILDLQERGIDTLTSFKILLANYQGEKIKGQYMGQLNHSSQNGSDKRRFNDNSWIKYQLIEKYIPQNSSKRFIEKQRESSDSIYNALKNGADFNALSIRCSDNSYDILPHWDRTCLLPLEIIPLLSKANKGDILYPILTPSGYSIIKVLDFSQTIPYELSINALNTCLSSADKNSFNGNLGLDELTEDLLYELAVSNDTISYQVTDKDIEEYYKENKSKFNYDEPHYKGAVIHCSSKKMAKVIKKYLKRSDYNDWNQLLDKLTKSDNHNVVIEKGIFKKGDNSFIDKLVFEKTKDDKTYSSSLPFSFVLGKKLGKKPDCIDDIKDIVKSDFLNNRVVSQNRDLVEKYKVEIDDDVLKTVNNSGSN